MPKLAKIAGYVIYFWSAEGDEPCHVHANRQRATANATKIWIEPEIKIAHNKSKIPAKDLKEILNWIANNREEILQKWQEFFS